MVTDDNISSFFNEPLTFLSAIIIKTLVTSTTIAMITENRAPIISAFRTGRNRCYEGYFNKETLAKLTVDISNVDKLVGYNVVSVMCGSRGSHRQAIDVKATRDNGEY